jgi:hypothetical protein
MNEEVKEIDMAAISAWPERRPPRTESERHAIAEAFAAHLPKAVSGRAISEEDIYAMRAAFITRFDEQLPRTETLMAVANVGYRMALRDVRTPASCSPDVVEKLARLISPEWFTEDGSPPVVNNFPDQHLRYQEAAREKARTFLADALESMMRRVDAMRWQPIEELAMPDPDGPIEFVVLWNGENVTVGVRRSEYSFEDALWIDRDGDMNPIVPPPTHWMPLPEPPRAALSDGIEEK